MQGTTRKDEDKAAEATRVAGFDKQEFGHYAGEDLYGTPSLVRTCFVIGCVSAWICGLEVQSVFGLFYFISPPPPLIVLTIILIATTVLSYINVNARNNVGISAGAMTFSIVFLLTVWTGLWGVFAALPSYYILLEKDLI